jgi:hypothetical protein
MRRKVVTGIAVTAVVLAVTVMLLLQQPGAQTSPVAVSKSTADGTPPATARPETGTAQPSTTPAPGPAPAPAPKQGSPSPAIPAPGEDDDIRVVDPGAPDAGSVPLPASKPLVALVTLPLPDTSSAVRSIVDGFPTGVIPTAPHSSIARSSVATEGSRLQAALTAKTSLSVVEVMDFYRTALAKLGLYDTPAPALNGSSALSFKRGNNTITLSATPVAGGCRYVVFGTFSAAT